MTKQFISTSLKYLSLSSVAVIALAVAVPAFAAGASAAAGQMTGANNDASTAAAPAKSGAEGFINSMAQRAIDFLSSGGSQEDKTSSFSKLLQDNFDMDTIGRFTLGRYWRQATPQQQQEYLQLFRKRVVEMYSRRFSDYTGQKFQVSGSRPDSNGDTIVSSNIISNEGKQPVQVDWRVRKEGSGYKVVDVVVAGISQSLSQQQQVDSIIQQGGGNVQAIIDNLNQSK